MWWHRSELGSKFVASREIRTLFVHQLHLPLRPISNMLGKREVPQMYLPFLMVVCMSA